MIDVIELLSDIEAAIQLENDDELIELCDICNMRDPALRHGGYAFPCYVTFNDSTVESMGAFSFGTAGAKDLITMQDVRFFVGVKCL